MFCTRSCESLIIMNINIFMSNSVVACEVSQSLMSDCDHMSVLQFHIRKYALTRTTIDNLVRAGVVMRSECDVHCNGYFEYLSVAMINRRVCPEITQCVALRIIVYRVH